MTDFGENLTLEEIEEHDRENFRHIIAKDAQTFNFATKEESESFLGQCVSQTMWKCANVKPGMDAKMMDRLMELNKTIVEDRSEQFEREDEENLFRNGLYIYKGGEIVAFIGCLFKNKVWGYSVITNVKL